MIAFPSLRANFGCAWSKIVGRIDRNYVQSDLWILDVKYVFSVFETEAKTLVFLVFLELQGP